MNALLNSLTKKTGVDAQYLFRGGLWVSIGTTIAFSATFILSVAFANIVPKEVYGTYKFILSITGILAALSLSGAGAIITRSVAQGFEGTYLTGVRAYLKFSSLSILAALMIAGYYVINDNQVLAISIAIAGIAAPLLRTITLYGSFLEGKRDFPRIVRYQFFHAFIPTGILVGTLFYTESVPLIVTVYFVTQLLVHGIIARLVHRAHQPNNEIDPRAKSFTFHTSIIGTLATIAEHIDKILLFHYVGAAQLALYTIAVSLPMQLNVITKGIKSLIYPKISARSVAEIQRHTPKRALSLLLLAIGIYTVYFFAAPHIFALLFPKYVEGVLLSQVFALTFAFIAIMPYRLALYAHSQTKQLYVAKIVTTITKFLLLALLLPLYGVWGALTAYLVAQSIEGIIFIYSVHFSMRA